MCHLELTLALTICACKVEVMTEYVPNSAVATITAEARCVLPSVRLAVTIWKRS
jgi:hypothetical protein